MRRLVDKSNARRLCIFNSYKFAICVKCIHKRRRERLSDSAFQKTYLRTEAFDGSEASRSPITIYPYLILVAYSAPMDSISFARTRRGIQ